MKVESSLCLTKGSLFLLNPTSNEVPFLVASLNLFLDVKGLIRSCGRIGKPEFHSQDVLFPILLPRFSHLTVIIIMDCHIKCLARKNVTLVPHYIRRRINELNQDIQRF